jgi:hypothetical protein
MEGKHRMTKTDRDLEPRDEDVQRMIDEGEPPRFRRSRMARWIIIVAVATLGIMAILTIMQEPL